MNQKKAKRIKREVYGDYSPKFRKYYRDSEGTIFCDKLRRLYKKAKKNG
jgi:hypothetical protein